MTEKLFFFLAFLTLLSALMVVFSKNPVHSVLYLILTFFSISANYILLNAQFLAVVNIIVYAGAIMVLFLFVIMFLNLRDQAEVKRNALLPVAASISGGMILVLLVASLKSVEVPVDNLKGYDSQIGMVQDLGRVLFKEYLVPFELASVLFISAMAGAVMLAKKEEGEKNAF